MTGFRVIALLTVRNEELVLERCLRHLIGQGIEVCLIDNDSTDRTLDIAQSYLGRGVCRIERLPFKGYYAQVEQCRQQEELAQSLDADWFIHHDADEIREAPFGWGTLADGIERIDSMGFTAIDFSEFVFVPTNGQIASGDDYPEILDHYYYFAPQPMHRVNAWRKMSSRVDLQSSGGHCVMFPGCSIAPEQFTLRHYICLSEAHLLAKYSQRRFPAEEVEQRGWHGWRARFAEIEVVMPPREALKKFIPGQAWDRSAPQTSHLFVRTRHAE